MADEAFNRAARPLHDTMAVALDVLFNAATGEAPTDQSRIAAAHRVVADLQAPAQNLGLEIAVRMCTHLPPISEWDDSMEEMFQRTLRRAGITRDHVRSEQREALEGLREQVLTVMDWTEFPENIEEAAHEKVMAYINEHTRRWKEKQAAKS